MGGAAEDAAGVIWMEFVLLNQEFGGAAEDAAGVIWMGFVLLNQESEPEPSECAAEDKGALTLP